MRLEETTGRGQIVSFRVQVVGDGFKRELDGERWMASEILIFFVPSAFIRFRNNVLLYGSHKL